MKATHHDYKTLHPDELREVCQSILEDDPELHAIVLEIGADARRKRRRAEEYHEPGRN